MQASDKEELGTVIQMAMCPKQISTDKKYKEQVLREISTRVNALLNSGGGQLMLSYKTSLSKKDTDDCVRMIEQKISDFVGTVAMISNIEYKLFPQKIVVIVKRADCLSTLNYGLFFPTKYQVISIPPSEPPDQVRTIMENTHKSRNGTSLTSYHRDFVLNQSTNLDEDTNVQCKCLKSQPSKCVTLADRMTDRNNKLACYISAFANYSGGHIYYGINDQRAVEGQEITDRQEIIRKVENLVNKMIWPKRCEGPKRGKQWDIFFEPIRDAQGKPVLSAYVIVVAIARCPGGVFVQKPESYYISGGKVQRMTFFAWMEHLTGVSSERPMSVPSSVPRVTWSSTTNRKIYQWLTSKLVQYRNDNRMEDFEMLSNQAISTLPETCAELVVASERVAAATKNHCFRKAEFLLTEFAKLTWFAQDVLFFEVKELYLKSRDERALETCKKSYETAQAGLQKMQLIPAGLLTAWFYIHANAVATILASMEDDNQRYKSLMNDAHRYLEMALRDADMLTDFQTSGMTDLKQKLYIYLAMELLAFTLTGEIVERKHVTSEDITRAASQLAAVQQSIFNGNKPTRFREIQFLLAQSDLYYRQSECSPPVKQTEHLKTAVEHSKKAQRLATECHFEENIQCKQTSGTAD